MEEETMENSTNNSNSMYYVLGAIVLVAVIGAGYLLRPKTDTTPVVSPQVMAPVATPTPGPISRLSCDTQYYNPVIGFPKYYLSVKGGDISGPTTVNCTMTVSQENKVVTVEKLSSPLTSAPERNGAVFTCTTQGLALAPTIPTKVDVALVDDQGAKATCSALFAMPKP